jgi:hypothetical protein
MISLYVTESLFLSTVLYSILDECFFHLKNLGTVYVGVFFIAEATYLEYKHVVFR